MDCINVYIQPFDARQSIEVVQNSKVTSKLSVDISQLSDTVKSIMSVYAIKTVNLLGSTAYLRKYQAEIGGTDYAAGLVDINIINR